MTRGPFIRNWLAQQDDSERPFTSFGDAVPPADLDFAAAAETPVADPGDLPDTPAFDDFAGRAGHLQRDFAGQPALLFVNAKLIVLLRRRDPPAHAAGMFRRLWTDWHAWLAARHDPRWLISSAQTLGGFGATEVQRAAGAEMATLLKIVKLYESERLFSAQKPEDLFHPGRQDAAIVMDLAPFQLGSGDADRALITRIWQLAERDPVTRSLAHRLIPELLADDRAIFRRLRKMRDRRRGK